MRSFKHLTPLYIFNRSRVLFDEMINPLNPWLTKDAIEIIEKFLKKDHVGLEIGSGRSTSWICNRIKKLTSIEGNEYWYQKVSRDCEFHIDQQRLKYLFLRTVNEYINFFSTIESNSLDFCLIDGEYRDICALNAVEKISNGGMLVIDNINWYFPIANPRSPASRSIEEGYFNKNWESFASLINSWNFILTSNGVTDTAIFIKQ